MISLLECCQHFWSGGTFTCFSVLLEHKLHLESLEQSHTAHLKVVEDDYLEKVEASEARFNAALEESEEKWRQKMNAELAERADEVEATIQDWRKKEEGWEEAKKALEDSVYNLRADLKDRDDALAASAARGGSKSSTGSTCSRLVCIVRFPTITLPSFTLTIFYHLSEKC